MPVISRRSLQAKGGISIRTRKGAPVFPESSPQNAVAFGVDNLAAGSNQNLLAAPGAGFCWVITSLFVSSDASGNGVRVNFTGGFAAVFNSPTNSVPCPGPQQLIAAPAAIAANTIFNVSTTLIGT